MAGEDGQSDGALKLAITALTERVPIITSTTVATAAGRGQYVVSYLNCGCRPSEQQQMSVQDDATRVRALARQADREQAR